MMMLKPESDADMWRRTAIFAHFEEVFPVSGSAACGRALR